MASRVGRLLLSRIASNASASTAPTADRIFQVAGSRLSGVQQSQSMLGSFAAMRSALAAEPRALWAATRSFRTSPTFSASEAAATQPAAPASVETVLKSRELVPSDQGNEVDQEVSVYTLDGKPTGKTITLPGDVFDVAIRRDIVHRVVRWQLAKRQQGTHKTKDRSEVSGTGKKPHQQKGTGNARQGTKRAPHHRGGGRAHGKVVRSHAHDVQRKVRRLGLKCALSAKVAEGNLVIIDAAAVAEPKTKALVEKLEGFAAARGMDKKDLKNLSLLLIDGAGAQQKPDGAQLRRAACNLRPQVDVLPSDGLNVYDVVRKRVLVMSEEAAREVADRLRAEIKR